MADENITDQNDSAQTVAEQTAQETNTSSGKSFFSGLKEKIMRAIDSGVEASKKGLATAGSAISDFGDKSVIRIELSQLNAKLDEVYQEIGKFCFDKIAGGEASVSASDEVLSQKITAAKDLLAKMKEKEEALSQVAAEKK